MCRASSRRPWRHGWGFVSWRASTARGRSTGAGPTCSAWMRTNAPVIVEYKRGVDAGVISQGLFYLSWLMDHRAEFQHLARDRLFGDDLLGLETVAPVSGRNAVTVQAGRPGYRSHPTLRADGEPRSVGPVHGEHVLAFARSVSAARGLALCQSGGASEVPVIRPFSNAPTEPGARLPSTAALQHLFFSRVLPRGASVVVNVLVADTADDQGSPERTHQIIRICERQDVVVLADRVYRWPVRGRGGFRRACPKAPPPKYDP